MPAGPTLFFSLMFAFSPPPLVFTPHSLRFHYLPFDMSTANNNTEGEEEEEGGAKWDILVFVKDCLELLGDYLCVFLVLTIQNQSSTPDVKLCYQFNPSRTGE